MGIINVISNMKKIHKEDIVLVKIGKFYYSYGKDAYILSYKFGYKLMKIEKFNVYSCAFPTQSYTKVIANLERCKINYLLVDRRNNYDVEEFSNNGNLNTYNKWFEKAKKSINIKIRMDKIYNYIIENMDKDYINNILNKMEEIINETRKI
mgnify:CR=1 FL=1